MIGEIVVIAFLVWGLGICGYLYLAKPIARAIDKYKNKEEENEKYFDKKLKKNCGTKKDGAPINETTTHQEGSEESQQINSDIS